VTNASTKLAIAIINVEQSTLRIVHVKADNDEKLTV